MGMDSYLTTLAKIYEFEKKGETVWFKRLVETLNLTKKEISKSLDRLLDCGILDCKYVKFGNTFVYTYYIVSESKDFAKEMYEEKMK